MDSTHPPASAGPYTPPDHPAASGGDELEEGVILNARRVTQAFVILAAAICFWLFWTVGGWVDFPVQFKHSGSVLFQGDPIGKLLVFWVLLVICTAVGTLLTSWRWFLAGLFCACLGSAAWTARGGILRFVLFSSTSPSVFIVLAIEQVLLLGGVAVMWLLLWRLEQTQLRADLPTVGGKKPGAPADGDPIFAIAAQTLAMGILVLLMAATDRDKQVSAAVFIAAACATALAQSLQKAPSLGKWYWAGPMLVGLIGYIGCYLGPRGWDLGQPTGTFAPLARPLPICYASFGMAGALFGYWMSVLPAPLILTRIRRGRESTQSAS